MIRIMIEDMAKKKNIFVTERSCVKSVQKTAQNLSYLESYLHCQMQNWWKQDGRDLKVRV
jgi:hypothetical protein